MCFLFFKQRTADEMRISDWSSDVCSSDLDQEVADAVIFDVHHAVEFGGQRRVDPWARRQQRQHVHDRHLDEIDAGRFQRLEKAAGQPHRDAIMRPGLLRSEEHTSELQSLMRISYAAFCLTKNKKHK